MKDDTDSSIVAYVGDGENVSRRVLRNHCGGNVEGSSLRSLVAKRLGYQLVKSRRPSGKYRTRIDLPNPIEGEASVSMYIRAGTWRYVVCVSPREANDFQWYVIAQLKPALNVKQRSFDQSSVDRYTQLFSRLTACPELNYASFPRNITEPGVYVLYHGSLPSQLITKPAARSPITHS